MRRKIGYPPFARLVKLEFRDLNPQKAEQMAQETALQVQTWIDQGNHPATELIGPSPCFFARQSGYYRWQLILRGPDPISILRGRPLIQARVVVDPPSLL